MNQDEAKTRLSSVVLEYRAKTYAFWKARIDGEPIVLEERDATGSICTIEIQSFWDGKKGEDIRVMFDIDYVGGSSFRPLCESFIVAENGQFVGE